MTSSEQPLGRNPPRATDLCATDLCSLPAEPRPPTGQCRVGGCVLALLLAAGLLGLNHAFNVYPLWADGDADGSRYASDRVKRLGQISLVIAGGLLLIFCILYAIAAVVWFAQTGDSDFHRRMR